MISPVPKSPYIISIDDDPDLLFLIYHSLKRQGYEVKTSLFGTDLPELLAERKPDMILLDINMGTINGGNICRSIKADSSTKHIPVLFLSGNKDVAEIACDCGADGWIQKPFNIHSVLAEIERYTRFVA
jgi:DNA-binding response OmpR family regulator